ncbi:hypothetical protein ONZ45_g3534 [Pleurotus djamor]|nr:hypothetical protein ONZ45_g3534 [Pleurotus djamor]
MTVPPPTPSSNPPSSPISPKFLTADDFASEHDHDKVDPPLLPRIGDTLPRGFVPTNFTPNNPTTALEPTFPSPFRVSHLTPPSQFQLIDTPMSVQYPSVTPMAKVSRLTGYAPYPTDSSQDAQHSPLPIYTKSPPNASHYTKLPSPVRLPPLTPLVQQSSLSPRARHIQSFPPSNERWNTLATSNNTNDAS